MMHQTVRRITWAATILAVSVLAVLARLSGYKSIPHLLGRALDWFASPGETFWWLSMGGAFQAFPNTTSGYTLLILSNTLAWFAAGLMIVRISRWVRRRISHESN